MASRRLRFGDVVSLGGVSPPLTVTDPGDVGPGDGYREVEVSWFLPGGQLGKAHFKDACLILIEDLKARADIMAPVRPPMMPAGRSRAR